MKNYLKIDIERAFLNKKFIFGIIGVVGVMIGASIETQQWHISVLNALNLVTFSMPFLLCFIFSTFTYGDSFCEDIECKYIYLQTIRGGLFKYTLSRVITIFISAFLTLAFGMILYTLLLKCYLPWSDLEESTYMMLVESGGFKVVLQQKWFLLYCILFSCQYGISAGILSVLASYISLFYSNRLFVLSIPLMVWYGFDYLTNYLVEITFLKPYVIFNASNNLWNNDLLSVLYAIGIGVILVLIIACKIYKKLRRMVLNQNNE